MTATKAIPKNIGRGVARFARGCAARPKILILSWSIALALLAGGVGVLYWQVHEHDQKRDARTAAVQAARERTSEVLAYEFTNLDANLRKARAHLTGQFRDQFTELTKNVISPAAKRDQIKTSAKVTSAGAMNASPDEVTALLFVNQTTNSKTLDKPKKDGSRLRVTMQRVDGDWLIADLTPI